jgi:hypothetical protein
MSHHHIRSSQYILRGEEIIIYDSLPSAAAWLLIESGHDECGQAPN